MDFNFSVVADQAQFSKFVHEKTHARSSRADHLSQSFLIDIRVNRPGVNFFSKIAQQEEAPRETFLTGIEQLVYQIFFNAAVTRQEVLHEQRGKLWLLFNRRKH